MERDRGRSRGVTLTCAALCPALLGVNLWPEEPAPRFLLCPDWAFCEFLPCPAEEEPRTVLLGELWEGREYGLVMTARPGEYRCLIPAVVVRGGRLPQPHMPITGRPHAAPTPAGARLGRCCGWPASTSNVPWWSPCAGEDSPAPAPHLRGLCGGPCAGQDPGGTVPAAPPAQGTHPSPCTAGRARH